ncbi:MAG: class I SAM-dependent methyltransferase [Pseudomonadota bacterium]
MHSKHTPHRDTRFWDRIAAKYARRPVKDQAAYEAKLTLLKSLLNQGDTVLEVGCGTGTTALVLAPQVARYIATDISPEMMKIAEGKRVAAGADNVTFHVATSTQMMPDAPFDAVMAFSLLHLVQDLPATLQALHDQLRPGGLFLSKTTCLAEANLAIRVMVKVMRLVGYAPHVLFLTQSELKQALRDAGFEIEEVQHFGKDQMTPFFRARRTA